MSLLNGSPTWMYNAGSNFYPHAINQSLRFNAADSSYLNRTPSSTTNRQTSTWSGWVKRSEIQKSGKNDYIFYAGDASSIDHSLYIYGGTSAVSDQLVWEIYDGNSYYIRSSAKLRDSSSWYHIVAVMDTTNSTAADRMRLYVNGERITSLAASANPTQNYNGYINNSSHVHYIGRRGNNYLDGYLAEVNFVDGTAYDPTSFGQTKEGIWIPKEYTGSHGTNGFYCKFVSGAIGTDSSGNGNNFTHTPGNTSRNRSTPDTPTNNFCLIPTTNNQSILAKEHQGMRLNTTRTGYWDGAYGSFSVKSGKWYYEVQMNETAGDNFRVIPGWKQEPEQEEIVFNRLGHSGDPLGVSNSQQFGNSGHYAYLPWSTQFVGNGGYTGTKAAASKGDVLNVAVDFDNNKIYFGLNGTYAANDGGTDGDPANGTNESLSGLYNNGKFYSPSVLLRNDNNAGSNSVRFNFGHDRSFGANLSLGTSYADENGFGEFRYAVPSGFLSLCSQNLPNPATVADPLEEEQSSDYFVTTLYTGTNSTNEKNIGFAPDLLWFKHRNGGSDHVIYDSIRGANSGIVPNNANAQNTSANSSQDLMSFDNDGFTVGVGSQFGSVNSPGHTIAAWAWKGGGTASSNSNGSITSSVSANTDAGFSVVSYTGNGGSSATVGHGLTQAPDCIWLKHRTAGEGWVSFWNTPDMGPTKFLGFNSTGAAATSSGEWNNTAPTNTVFTIGNQGRVNTNTATYIAYCFHNVDGYCKVGEYRGNANADGPTINCGFRPAWILIRRTASGSDWCIYDSKRLGYNVDNNLQRIAAGSEQTDDDIDIYSTGFKLRRSSTNFNGSGNAHVYIAFSEQALKYANAR